MRLVKITVLTLIIALCASVLCFATDEETPDFSSVVSPYDDILEEIFASGGTKVAYDANDIYLLLNTYFKGSLYNTSYSSNLGNSPFLIGRLCYYLDHAFGADFYLAGGDNVWQYTADSLHYIVNGTTDYSQAQLQAMTWGKTGDILTSTQAISQSTSQSNTTLQSINSKLTNYSWTSSPVSNITVRTSIDGTPISSNVSGFDFYVSLSFDSSFDSYLPNVFRIFFPIERFTSTGVSDQSFIHIPELSCFVNNNRYQLNVPDYFIEQTATGFYAYFFGFNPYSTDYYTFHIHLDKDATYRYWTSVSASYIPFNTDDYQFMKTAFYQQKSANSFGSIDQNVQLLADRFIDSDVQAAEQASQGVIDDTLTGFTGNGSAAAKVSDSTAMKNMSGSVQSGLSTGASASNATSVFSNTTFWSWFTQATSNGINNAYPAPTVSQSRDGDQVVDFLSRNENDLHDLLNQRDSW